MARSKSSGRWLQEHYSDPYVQRSRSDGYRSRASFKLVELDKKDHLLRPGAVVVDLGAAPGGWSQVVAERIGSQGYALASDILPMDPIAQVDFIQGDFSEDQVYEQLLEALNGRPVDLVISDMAPNMSGNAGVDQARSMHLVELALELASQVLKPGGTFLTKVFQGEGFEALVKDLRPRFDKVQTRKPDASRARSREVYLLCKGMKSI